MKVELYLPLRDPQQQQHQIALGTTWDLPRHLLKTKALERQLVTNTCTIRYSMLYSIQLVQSNLYQADPILKGHPLLSGQQCKTSIFTACTCTVRNASVLDTLNLTFMVIPIVRNLY